MIRSLAVAFAILWDLISALFRSRTAVIAENLFLRRQLALYLERETRQRRPTPATKIALVVLSQFFAWKTALAIVKPDTLIRRHRAGFRSLMALEVPARWSATAAQEPTRTHCADGPGESKLGRRANRRRIVSQTWSPR